MKNEVEKPDKVASTAEKTTSTKGKAVHMILVNLGRVCG
jgi:hypothetical protein